MLFEDVDSVGGCGDGGVNAGGVEARVILGAIGWVSN